jgi:transposase
MLGPPKPRHVARPVLASLDDLVPPGHFSRHLEATLALAFVRDLVRDRYAAGGRPGLDPVVYFKLQLVLCFEGLRSEQQLVETASLHLAHRWDLGDALDEPLPAPSTLSRIRARLGVDVFRRCFERVVELCQEAGLVWGRELCFDATKVRANAAVDSVVPRLGRVVGDHRPHRSAVPAGTAESDAPPDSPPARDAPAPVPVPGAGAIRPRSTAPGPAPARGWDLLEACRLDPQRPAVSASGYARLSARLVSRTDPDAALMHTAGSGRATLGSQAQYVYVVDGGKARVLLHALVAPADVMEGQPMRDFLWRVRFRWKVRPRWAVGDSKSGTAANIRALEDAGIRAYVALPDTEHRESPSYPLAAFRYDAARDRFWCPQGHPLRRERTNPERECSGDRGDPAICTACPVRAACTPGTYGRQVHRSFHAASFERVRGYHATAAYKKAMRKRAVWVEPLFGEAKPWHGLRRFWLRGLAKPGQGDHGGPPGGGRAEPQALAGRHRLGAAPRALRRPDPPPHGPAVHVPPASPSPATGSSTHIASVPPGPRAVVRGVSQGAGPVSYVRPAPPPAG